MHAATSHTQILITAIEVTVPELGMELHGDVQGMQESVHELTASLDQDMLESKMRQKTAVRIKLRHMSLRPSGWVGTNLARLLQYPILHIVVLQASSNPFLLLVFTILCFIIP